MSVSSYVSNASSLRSRGDKDTGSLRSRGEKDSASLRSKGEKDNASSKTSPGASRQLDICHTKKLINAPETCVEDMLSGIATAYPGLGIDTASKIILRFEPEESACVGIISGGGSGHEPFAAGFVGSGMLAAAVAGNVFASPPASNCVTAIMNVADHYRGGVLVLILNYTGDVLNFGQAIEEVKDRNVQAEGFVFGEDCALVGENHFVGKRGLCGMLFIIKIAGALSLMHNTLLQIIDVLKQVQSQIATLGVCTWPSSVPGASAPLFVIKENDLEFGVGIHGEAGIGKILVRPANEVVEIMLRKLCGSISLKSGDEVCVMINNLGGSSQMEVFIMLNEVIKQLEKKGITIARVYAGTFMTSLEMGGIQVTLLRVSGHSDWLKLLDYKTDAIAWPACILSNKNSTAVTVVKRTFFENKLFGPELTLIHARIFKKCIEEVANQLMAAESKLNQLDSGCGDGDCGSSFKRFAEGVLVVLDSLPVKRPASCLMQLASIASNLMGGTSGGFYSLMLRGAARSAPDWVLAWESALDTVRTYTSAKVGYRTMMDALIPAFEKFTTQMEQFGNWEVALRSAVREADAGCERTKKMKALLGRASYVSEKYLTDVDAGAYAVTVWLKAIQKVIVANIKSI